MNPGNSSAYDTELSSFMVMMQNELDNKIAFQLPLTIGQYRLEELVGRGGMGDVYRAENLVLKRTEALKFVRSKLLLKPEAIQRFREEIESTAKLLHPNVVTVFNAGEFEGRPYMVMEFLEGWTVHEYVRRRKELYSPLSVQEAVDIVVQAARGLQFAHDNGFVHRDVKPGNLWITPDKTVKVLDLGLAIATSQDADSHIVGTPDFMSPEQSFPDSVPSPRSDIYSLGCTLFYILTGQVPFGGEKYSTSEKKMEAQRELALPPLSNFRKDVPARIQQVLNRMTAKSADDRYASMTEVIDALKNPSKKTPLFAALAGVVLLGSVSLWGLNANNTPNVTVQNLPPNSDTVKPIQDVTDPFPLGKEAGEKLVRVVDGVEYVFRWCPPGEFVMGNRGVPISKSMSAERLLEIVRDNNLLSLSDINELDEESKNLLYESRTPDEIKKNEEELKNRILSMLCSNSRIFYEGSDFDAPHPVTLTKGFWMLDCEVTLKMWLSVMPNSTANAAIQSLNVPDDAPVRMVSWNDAQEFCQTLSEKLHADVCLPTEAQWEYACRANTEESPELTAAEANSSLSGMSKPANARSFSPNAWGLYEMPGNVEEWVADWYVPITDSTPQTDPTGPAASKIDKHPELTNLKVLRGFNYLYNPEKTNFYSSRDFDNIDARRHLSGFRICVIVESGN